MPRKKKQLLTKHVTYNDDQIFQLATGVPFFFSFRDDDEAARQAWGDPAVRQKVYALHTERQRRPGSDPTKKPWAERMFGRYNKEGHLINGEKQGSS